MNDSDRSRSLTMTNGMRKSFGPGGCQATTDSHRKCGETKTLQIIEEFRKLYENKMKQIDAEAGGDCVQAKINLQQDWIRDLTEQNEMLVRAVEELEVEAADRVNMLEEKLKSSSKCACELQKALKEKDKRLKELEERLKSEEGLESKKELQDLKKDNEDKVKLEQLYDENLKLHKHITRMQLKLNEQKPNQRSRDKQVQTDGEISKYFNILNNMTRGAEGEGTLPNLQNEQVKLYRLNMEQNLPKYSDKQLQTVGEGSKCYDLQGMIKGIEEERVLVLSLEKEVHHMLREMYFKEKQLLDLNDLVGVLVRKLFHVYKKLTLMEKTIRKCFEETENPSDMKQFNLIDKYRSTLLNSLHCMQESINTIGMKPKS